MRVRCHDAEAQLEETNDACKSLLDRAGSLREERLLTCMHSARRSVLT